jgi:hypothetical protein
MHRNNHATFLLRQIESESTRAITPYSIVLLLINPVFGVSTGPRPRWTVVMCLARLSMAPISYKYAVPARF